MNPDLELLRRYVDHDDETAFAELVNKHLPLVFRAACRQLGGNLRLSEDVAQAVFSDLARKATSLTSHPVLAAWLHTATRHAVARVNRSELLRKQREKEAGKMNEIEQEGMLEVRWEQLQPVIDEVLTELKELDREAVLLRFFEEKTYAEVGVQLGVSEDAARMRVDRALEKLRGQLVRRGIGSTVTALGLALPGQSALAVPAGLVASVTQASLAAAGASGAGLLTGWLATGSAKVVALAGVAGVVIAGSVLLSSREEAKTGATNETAGEVAQVDAVAVLLEKWDWVSSEERTQLLEALSAEDVGALLRRLWEENTEQSRRRFHEIFDQWCVSSPEPAAKWAVTMWDEIPGREGEKLREQAGLAWSAVDLENAFAWALTLRDANSEEGLAAKMLGQLAKTNPYKALAMAKAVSSEFYQIIKARIFEGWLELSPSEAFAVMGDGCYAGPNSNRYLAKWADRDPVAALKWALARGDNGLSGLSYYVSNKGYLTQQLYDSDIKWDYGKNILASYLLAWLQEDETDALQWLDSLPETENKLLLIKSGANMLIFTPDHKFIPVNVSLATRLPAGDDRDSTLRYLFSYWSRSDPDKVLSWLENHNGDEHLKASVLPGAIAALSKESLDEAIFQTEAIKSESLRLGAVIELATVWSKDDAIAAVAWLNRVQPDWAKKSLGFGGFDTIPVILRNWIEKEPDNVIRWMNEDFEVRKWPVKNGLCRLASGDPSIAGKPRLAIQIARSLPQGERDSVEVSLWLIWLSSSEREEALGALEQETEMTEAEKQDIRKQWESRNARSD